MKTCPKCNMSGIPDDAMFCPKCGEKIVRRKKDSRQLMNEALSAWEKYPNKPQNNVRKIGKAAVGSCIFCTIIGGIFCVAGLIKGEDINQAFSFGLYFSLFAMMVAAVPLLLAALILYIQYYKELKDDKNTFIEKYIQAHEYE